MDANSLNDKLCKLNRDIASKKKEIEKRREVIETVSSTYVSRKKDEAKLEAIDTKISSKTAIIDKTIDYYKTEIEKSERKLQDDIEIIKKKADIEIEKLKNKFESYRLYCLSSLQAAEEKRTVLTEPLEKKKEALEATMDKSEDDDKLLVRLKVELKQMVEDERETNELFMKTSKEESERRIRQAKAEERTALEEARVKEAIQRERELQYVMAERQQEKQKDEERWAQRRKQEEEDREKEKLLAVQREKEKTQKERFQSEIYPNLSDTAKEIFTFFKYHVDPHLVRKARNCSTVEECETYLVDYQDTVTVLENFKQEEYSSLSAEKQDQYDQLNSLDEQLRFIKKLNQPKEIKKKSSTTIPLNKLKLPSY